LGGDLATYLSVEGVMKESLCMNAFGKSYARAMVYALLG